MVENLNSNQRVVLGIAVLVALIGLSLLLVPQSFPVDMPGLGKQTIHCGSVISRGNDVGPCDEAVNSQLAMSLGIVALSAIGGMVGVVLAASSSRPRHTGFERPTSGA